MIEEFESQFLCTDQTFFTIFKQVYRSSIRRTELDIDRVQISFIEWGSVEEFSFYSCKRALNIQIPFAQRNTSLCLFVYTDVSNIVWSRFLTQPTHGDLPKPHENQQQSVLAVLCNHFPSSQLRWSKLSKKAYAIKVKVDRMHWVLTTSTYLDLFTDRYNLEFSFDPPAFVPDLSSTSLKKGFW